MDTRKLQCFVEVARQLHFGRAAERLFMNQSSVSESIKSLEGEVGGRLFERTSRRVRLTPLGESFLKDLEPVLIALDAAVEEARRRARGDKIEFNVGYLGGGFYELSGQLTDEFERVRPDARVNFIELTYLNQISAITEGVVDAALTRLPVGLAELHRSSVLFQDSRMLAVPEHHRLAEVSLVDPEELHREPMVRLPEGASTPRWREYHFPTETPSGRPIPDGPIIRTVREGLAAVESGRAVMTITRRAQAYFRQPNVVFVELDLPPIQSALVSRVVDRRSILRDFEQAAIKVAARMGTLLPQVEEHSAC